MERRYTRQQIWDATALRRAAHRIGAHPNAFTGLTDQIVEALRTNGDYTQRAHVESLAGLAGLTRMPDVKTRMLAAKWIEAPQGASA